MPTHVFTLAALGHAVDAQTNTISLYSILEQIGGPTLPLTLPSFVILTLWQRNEGEEGVKYVQRTSLVDPDGEETFHQDAEFEMPKPRHRMFLAVAGAPFKKSGVYQIKVRLRQSDERDWQRDVASYPIEVRLAEARSATPLLNNQESP
ncbi:MAG TPA: hypothetical protein VM219_04495 [Phycisphaerae bacterium]|nr:hypothetical protein [Phycisphaerae bacterium]